MSDGTKNEIFALIVRTSDTSDLTKALEEFGTTKQRTQAEAMLQEIRDELKRREKVEK